MKKSLFLKPVAWLAFICYGLFLPAKDLPMKSFLKIPYFDKMVHFTLFFIFCLLLFRPFKLLKTKYLIWAPLTALILGAILESIQRSISHTRSSDIMDFIANATGILISLLFFRYFVLNKKWEKWF